MMMTTMKTPSPPAYSMMSVPPPPKLETELEPGTQIPFTFNEKEINASGSGGEEIIRYRVASNIVNQTFSSFLLQYKILSAVKGSLVNLLIDDTQVDSHAVPQNKVKHVVTYTNTRVPFTVKDKIEIEVVQSSIDLMKFVLVV